jgi:diacylglycerol kinase
MVRSQPNFLVHLSAAVLALAAGVVFRLSATELALLVLTIAFVLVTECVNTVLETLCDLVSPSFHPLVKRAKDVAAGAVLIGAIASVGVGLLLFGPRVLAAV